MVYHDDAPPHAATRVLADRSALAALQRPDPLGGGRMHDRVKACELFSHHVGGDIPIMGWVEGPMAQAVDLRGMSELMMDIYDAPQWVEDLFDWVTEMEIAFALAQIQAGADLIGVGDAAASLVSADIYETMILPRERRIVQAIRDAGAFSRLHICGNTTHLLPHMHRSGAELIELDHTTDIRRARELCGPGTVLMGNFDPVAAVYSATPGQVMEAARRSHETLGHPYILAAGCEIPPRTPRENIKAMFRYAHEAR